MKKFLLLLLVTVCVFFSGCEGKDENADGIDVDLTALSSVMVSAQLNDILSENPESYVGKTIKIDGVYNPIYYDVTGLYYHYVDIEGADSCCALGMEFKLSGERAYPDDYPQEQTKIEVTGVFGSYQEMTYTIYYLEVDDIVLLQD